MPFPVTSSPWETFQATGKAKAPEGTTWGRHPPALGNGPPAGPQTGHSCIWLAHRKQESVAESAGRAESHGKEGGKEAEVTDPEHGRKKMLSAEGYCVAMRVPFVLIKTDRRSASNYHTEKCEPQRPLPLGEALLQLPFH